MSGDKERRLNVEDLENRVAPGLVFVPADPDPGPGNPGPSNDPDPSRKYPRKNPHSIKESLKVK